MDLARVHELGDAEQPNGGRTQRIRSILIGVREAAICGAEVNSDDVGHGGYSISISAGARIVACEGANLGSSILSTRQPLWRRIPWEALPSAGTFPSSFMAAGSFGGTRGVVSSATSVYRP